MYLDAVAACVHWVTMQDTGGGAALRLLLVNGDYCTTIILLLIISSSSLYAFAASALKGPV